MIILVDSSVWIDFFNAKSTVQSLQLRTWLVSENIVVADLVMTEVLQGARTEAGFRRMVDRLAACAYMPVCDPQVVLAAARNYRTLRAKGITIRKTVDTLIATRCILDHIPLLYSDRDFDPFVEHLGLRSALDLPGVN